MSDGAQIIAASRETFSEFSGKFGQQRETFNRHRRKIFAFTETFGIFGQNFQDDAVRTGRLRAGINVERGEFFSVDGVAQPVVTFDRNS